MQHTPAIVVARRTSFVVVAIAAVLLVACGAGVADEAVATPDTIKIVQEGGCRMMGPNCPTYELHRDGQFALFRTGEPEVVSEAEIDSATADEVWSQVARTDVAALVERAGPGECQACVDGVDTVIEYALGGEVVRLASTDIAFDGAEPFFVVFGEAISAMANTAPMPIETR